MSLRIRLAVVVFSLFGFFGRAHADVGLLLNEVINSGMNKWTNSGHSAIYLSNVCAETPLKARLCGPGEQGSILSNYQRFGEDKDHEWNLVPLNIFLYGVESEHDRPLYGSMKLRAALQDRYRAKYLQGICSDACASDSKASWRDTVGVTFARDIYVFTVRTTREQDQALIDRLNADVNVNHYNGFTSNCADFAKSIINSLFPNAARRDRINDFGMTSPKAIAKSFTHYARKRPELGLRVVRYSQLPGEYKRSLDDRKGTEMIYRSNRWRLPLMWAYPHELILFTSTYLVTGRFNPEREVHRTPTSDITQMVADRKDAKHEGDHERVAMLDQQIKHERVEALGTREEWSGSERTTDSYVREAEDHDWIADSKALGKLPRKVIDNGQVKLAPTGAAWVESKDENGLLRTVGVSASTVVAEESDPQLSYLLLLSRVHDQLHRKHKDRELVHFFRSDWRLMEHARSRVLPPSLATSEQESSVVPGGGVE